MMVVSPMLLKMRQQHLLIPHGQVAMEAANPTDLQSRMVDGNSSHQ